MKVDDALLLHGFYDQVLNRQAPGVGVDIDLAWDMQEDMDDLAPHIERYEKARLKAAESHGKLEKDSKTQFKLHDPEGFLEAIEKLLAKEIDVKVTQYPQELFRAGLRGIRVNGGLKKAKELLVINSNGQDSKKRKP